MQVFPSRLAKGSDCYEKNHVLFNVKYNGIGVSENE